MIFLKLENNKVVNIIDAEQSFIDTLPDTYINDNKAGIGWELVSGVLVDTTPEPVLPTFEENKTQKVLDLNTYINTQKRAFEAPYDDMSISSFDQKANECMMWEIDNTMNTPWTDKLCTYNGTLDTAKRDALRLAILAKVNGTSQLEQFADDTRTAIKVCTTQTELDAIIIP